MKTCQAAALVCQNGQGLVMAVEKDPSRATRLQEVLARNCGEIEHNIKVVQSDFLQVHPKDHPQVEYMIVDVECTGSGRAEYIDSAYPTSLAKLMTAGPDLQQ